MSTEELVPFGSFTEEEAAASQSTNKNRLKLEVGKTRVRVLPPQPGRPLMKIVYMHYVEVPGATNSVSFACPRMMSDGARHCVVCAKAQKLDRSGNPADKDRASALFPRRKVYLNAINRAAPEKGPQLWEVGKTIHDQLVALRKDNDAGGDFSHPLKGYDLIVERTGTGRNDTRYTVLASRNSSPLGPDVPTMNNWIKNQPDLDGVVRILSEDEIQKKLMDAANPPTEPNVDAPKGRLLEASEHPDDDIPF